MQENNRQYPSFLDFQLLAFYARRMHFAFSPNFLKMLALLGATLIVAIIIDIILRSLIRVPHHFDTRRSRTVVTVLRNIITVTVYAIAIYVMFVILGVNITPLLASAGIVGLVIGLGAKSLIEDLIAGLFLLTQDSIAIGDAVKINDAEGKIERINFRILTIRAGDGSLYIIPNGQIKSLINFSRHKSRAPIEIPMKADQPIDTVIKAANEALAQLEKDKEIAPFLFPGSSVNGIEDFRTDGHMILKATIISSYDDRALAARKFRYLLKKSFEKHKLSLG